MSTITKRPTLRKAQERLTANSCSAIAAPLIAALAVKKPRFHAQHRVGPLNEMPSFGETTIISGKPHIFISRTKCAALDGLIQTISHELIHVWQFTNQHNCRGEVFSDFECEIQAYALEPLATVALAASYLSARQVAVQVAVA